jgi:hypothetical protein
VASRVEVFERECGLAHYYDINSSFPHSMNKPQPGRYIGTARRLRDSDLHKPCLVECDVNVPECYLPPLPFRHEQSGRIFFPTGKWSGWFDGEDIRLLLENGGKVQKLHQIMTFEPFDDLKRYVDVFYEKKANATDPFLRFLYKRFLNALYGKFAEREDKRRILIHPEFTTCPHNPIHPDNACMRIVMPGVWEVDDAVSVPHAHVPIAAHVTALSRSLLFNYMKPRKRLYYCDTDSVVTSDVLATDDKELGALKYEHRIKQGHFAAPKLYGFKDKAGEWHVKSKGFRKLGIEEFRKLVEGEALIIERMAKLRENLRRNRIATEDIVIKKRLHNIMPKRADTKNGRTRPWSIQELDES